MRRLLNGIFGPKAYTIVDTQPGEVSEPKRQERLKQIDEQLKQGNPVPVNILWDDGAHEVLVTHIDRQSGMAYFMNPWGELHKMPLAELEKRMQDFTVSTAPGTGQPAHQTLVPPAHDLTAYSEVPGEKYRTHAEMVAADPDLSKLSKADQKTILAVMKKCKLSKAYMRPLAMLAKDGTYLSAALKELGKAQNEEQVFAILVAYLMPARGVQKGLMTREKANELVALQLHQRLNSADLDSLAALAHQLREGKATPEESKNFDDLIAKAKAIATRQDSLEAHLQGLKSSKGIQQRLHKLMTTSPLAPTYHAAAMAADKAGIKRLDQLFTAIESWNAKRQLALSEAQVAGLLQKADGLTPKEHTALLKALLKGDEATAAKILGVSTLSELALN
jgi:hypothetical protein